MRFAFLAAKLVECQVDGKVTASEMLALMDHEFAELLKGDDSPRIASPEQMATFARSVM